MTHEKKSQMMVEIARLYYEYNYNQAAIANKLGISRTYVSKLLDEARTSGIVEIKIHDVFSSESAAEQSLCEKFHLKKAIVIPTPDDDPNINHELGRVAAEYLNTIIRDGDIIGVSWGSTLHAFSDCVIPRNDLSHIRVVQLSGGVSQVKRNIFTSEIVANIANALGGTGYPIPLPPILDNRELLQSLVKDTTISSVFDLAEKTTISVCTVGAFNEQSSFVRSGFLNSDDLELFRQKNAVGDLCSHIINSDGQICDEDYDRRTVSVSYEILPNIPMRIGIASNPYKEACLRAALLKNCFSVLVTNEAMAKRLLIQ